MTGLKPQKSYFLSQRKFHNHFLFGFSVETCVWSPPTTDRLRTLFICSCVTCRLLSFDRISHLKYTHIIHSFVMSKWLSRIKGVFLQRVFEVLTKMRRNFYSLLILVSDKNRLLYHLYNCHCKYNLEIQDKCLLNNVTMYIHWCLKCYTHCNHLPVIHYDFNK